MSMFVTVDATVKVQIVVLAASAREGLADASATLRQCRLVRPAFWKRSWLERLFAAPSADDSMPVKDVVAAQVLRSEYAGGE